MLYVFTLTWNGLDKLTKLKESLIPALQGINYTWLIKDNASKDETVSVASSWEGNIKVIPYKDNRQNFAEGMNFLFNEASPADNDQILLLNNDVIFNDQNSLKSMREILGNDPEVGVVGARLLYTGTNRLQHAGVVFDPAFHAPIHFRCNEPSDEQAEKDRLFQVVTGAVLLTKADHFRNVYKDNKSGINGMDERFIWAFDDVDFCLSIHHNLKKKIVYCGKTNIFHEESASLKKNPANKLFVNHNLKLLREKWNGRCLIDKDIYLRNPNHNLYRK